MVNESVFVVQPTNYSDNYGEYGVRKSSYPTTGSGITGPAQVVSPLVPKRDFLDYVQIGLIGVIAVGLFVNIMRK